jgi:GR25 family glycosyltransferase involved in LPS biosynthesis
MVNLVINLKTSNKRWELFKERNKKELDFERFDAVDGRKSTFKDFKEYFNNLSKKNLNTKINGNYGCFFSHLKCWEFIANLDDNDINNNDVHYIFEDDCILTENFLEKANNLIKTLPNDWNILNLYHNIRHNGDSKGNYNEDIYIPSSIRKGGWNTGTVAYCITTKGAKLLAKLMNSIPFKKKLDIKLDFHWKQFYDKIQMKTVIINMVRHDWDQNSDRREFMGMKSDYKNWSNYKKFKNLKLK